MYVCVYVCVSAMDALERQAAAEGRYSMMTQETMLRLIKSTNTQP